MREYDEDEGIVKISPPKGRKRKSLKLGTRLTVEEIEASIEKGQSDG